jgi:hypothetical protein
LLAAYEGYFPWRLVGAGKQGTNHHGVGPSNQSLRDVSRKLQSAIGNNWNAGWLASQACLVDGGDLWNTNTGYYTRGAN